MKIGLAHASDIEAVLALIEELLAELGEEGEEFARIDREKLHADIRRDLYSGRFMALLALDASDTPIGVLTLSASFALYAGGEYGVIDEMYVRPEYRSAGVGRRLIEAAVTLARSKDWFRLDVTGPVAAFPGSPDRAVAFYERAGFEYTGPKLRLLVPTDERGKAR